MKYRVWNVRRFMKENEVVLLANGNLLFLVEGTDSDYVEMNELDVKVTYFTGVKDKNGKEIYEGDLLKISDREDTQEVDYSEACFGTNEFTLFELIRDKGRTIEVTGNIYEQLSKLGKWE